MTSGDRDAVRAYFDRFAEGEWDRLSADVRGRVSFEVHRRFLERFVQPGQRVLEIGAGPGRFTEVLAGIGARVVVTDLSPVQLDLNRERLGSTAAEAAVERREIVDVCDLSRYADDEFDAVLAYGGPLSYVFEEVDAALAEMLRVTAPGGVVVGSVMSTLGAWRSELPGAVQIAQALGEDVNDAVLRTGDLRLLGGAAHVCRMFRSSEVVALAERHGARVEALSASNWASLGDRDVLATLEADGERWVRFLDNEVRACAEPGAVDGGTHILFAVKEHGAHE